VFENRTLREKWQDTGEDCIMRSFTTCTVAFLKCPEINRGTVEHFVVIICILLPTVSALQGQKCSY
jgi:hypothetical protein